MTEDVPTDDPSNWGALIDKNPLIGHPLIGGDPLIVDPLIVDPLIRDPLIGCPLIEALPIWRPSIGSPQQKTFHPSIAPSNWGPL